MDTIRWSTAVERMSIAPKIQIEVSIPVSKEEALEEIKTTHIECMTAMDINMFANDAGITPNECRRMMIQPDGNDNENFKAILNTFEDDETDSLFDYF